MYYEHGNGWGGGHWIAMIVMMVLFWSVIAAVAIAVMRSGSWSRRDAPPPSEPSDPTRHAERILHERFARGEIDEAEYTRRHDLLKSRSH